MLGNTTKTYAAFADQVLEMESLGYLEMVKSKGRNHHTPSLAYQYKINKGKLNKEYHQELQRYRLKLHDGINLDAYFNLDRTTWKHDLPYLEKIHQYIVKNGFPLEDAAAPERSFELVRDEKWIVEQKGSEILNRIGLWEQFRILPVSDPLMFAINPLMIHQQTQLHLIVENKTTYQGLLPVIMKTDFSTLIYGSGNKIVKSIENFTSQYPIEANHIFYYFGDLDQSGITIWNSLNKRQTAIPAYPFYHACLSKPRAYGKTNQRPNEAALNEFLTFFNEEQQIQINELLSKGAYYPQEVLKTKELQHIWEDAEWTR
ncbi:hypothetical protein CWR48_15350 [Oceanobacillus arenosus]|uniref:Wadjet protein JetD C-terminal domain-containing protein n=2 Tax=Oceanobacillus arenosus TaxID=1229153 RepID=A0A3D8PP93_9BACI|nr:hypothetical protein CWR48_15350 [Oceanobacillus arenosus]